MAEPEIPGRDTPERRTSGSEAAPDGQLALFPTSPAGGGLDRAGVWAGGIVALALLWVGLPTVWKPGFVVLVAIVAAVVLGIRRGGDPVKWTLGGLLVVWSLGLVAIGWQRYDRFFISSFDLSFYDQGLWLLSRFKVPFLTVRGINLFGHHISPTLFLLVPCYWLGAGPKFLLVVQVASQAAGAVAVYLLARDLMRDRWVAVGLATVLLLHPAYQLIAYEYFHPESLALGPLLLAYWAARTHRWRWFAVAAVLAVGCKEDVALPVVVLGLLVAWRGHRLIGLVTAGAALAWFVLSTQVLLPAINDGGRIFDTVFAEFGDTPMEAVRTAVTDPAKTWEVVTRQYNTRYYRLVLAPVAFLPLVAIPTLLIAAPMALVNVLSSVPYQQEIRHHYVSLVVAGVILATVEAMALLSRRREVIRRPLVGFLLASSFATTVAWGVWPLNGVPWVIWNEDNRRTAIDRAMDGLPGDARVSASFTIVPHLTHRTRVYNFPLPWFDQRVTHWGVRGENLHDPATVRWLLLDRQRLTDDADPRAAQLLDRLLAEEFALRFESLDVVLAERVASPRGP